MHKNHPMADAACPCGSATAYRACCQPWHLGQPAPTAEALMRSRYTAYVLELEDYLLQTWHPDTRPDALGLGHGMQAKWLGLEIIRFESTAENAAIVEFRARYKMNGKAGKLHELSCFVKLGRNWYYVNGEY